MEIEDIRIGDIAEVFLDRNYSSNVLDISPYGVKLDFINNDGQHKRDQWIPFDRIVSFTKPNLDSITINKIITYIKMQDYNLNKV